MVHNILLSSNEYLCYKKKRGTAMPHSELEVLGKPIRTNVVMAAHAKRENHYAIFVRN